MKKLSLLFIGLLFLAACATTPVDPQIKQHVEETVTTAFYSGSFAPRGWQAGMPMTMLWTPSPVTRTMRYTAPDRIMSTYHGINGKVEWLRTEPVEEHPGYYHTYGEATIPDDKNPARPARSYNLDAITAIDSTNKVKIVGISLVQPRAPASGPGTTGFVSPNY